MTNNKTDVPAVKRDRKREDLLYSVAQLRHLYKHLIDGTFKDPKQLADGLLAPEIRRIEGLLKDE